MIKVPFRNRRALQFFCGDAHSKDPRGNQNGHENPSTPYSPQNEFFETLLIYRPIMNRDISTIVSDLRAQRKSILDEWIRKRKQNAERENVILRSRKAWMDHLPKILDQLLDCLERGEKDTDDLGDDHGKQRLLQRFDLAESILDLNLLEEILHQRVAAFLSTDNGKGVSSDALHKVNTTIATFLNDCVVETSHTHLRQESAMSRRRELHLQNRLESLGIKLRENLEIVGASTHDLKGSNEVLFRLAEHALNSHKESGDSTSSALLEALSRGLLYNQEILEDLSILSIDRNPGEPEELDAEEVIRTIGTRCALAFGDPDSRIRWKATQSITLYLNRLGLERIFSNLIDNAFNHGADAPVILNWYSAANEQNQWTFEIENKLAKPLPPGEIDSGCWIEEPEFIEIGLGLSVVTNLIENMGGELHFQVTSDDSLKIRARLPLRMTKQSLEAEHLPAAL